MTKYDEIYELLKRLKEEIKKNFRKSEEIFDFKNQNVIDLIDIILILMEFFFSNLFQTLQIKYFYQLILEKFPKTQSVNYISTLNYLKNDKEKTIIWLIIELFYQKNLVQTLEKIEMKEKEKEKIEDFKIFIELLATIQDTKRIKFNSYIFIDFENLKTKRFSKQNELNELKQRWNFFFEALKNERKENKNISRSRRNSNLIKNKSFYLYTTKFSKLADIKIFNEEKIEHSVIIYNLYLYSNQISLYFFEIKN